MKLRLFSAARLSFPLASALAALLAASFVQATSLSWVGGFTNANWSAPSNWSGTPAPGSTSLTNSADIATFNVAIANTWGNAVGNPIVIDFTTQNIGGLNFNLAAGNYFIGSTAGNPLLLSSGGTTQVNSGLTVTNAIETINAPLSIQGASGTYSLTNGSPSGAGLGAGTLIIGGGITGAVAGATVLTIQGSNTNANTISGIIGNGTATTLAITKSGAGTWVLSGNTSTYSGGTTVSAGTLILTGTQNLGTGAIAVNAGTLQLGINGTANGNNALVASNTVTLASGTTLAINQSNTPLSYAAFQINMNGASTISFQGANLYTDTIASAIVLNNTGGANAATIGETDALNTINLTGAISGTGDLKIAPGGNGNFFTVTTNKANSYVGNTFITQTTTQDKPVLRLLAGGSLPSGTVLTITAGTTLTSTFDLNGQPQTIAGLTSAGTATGDLVTGITGSALTVSSTTVSSTFGGVISGAMSLTKAGAGTTLTLSGANTYTGNTIVSAGTLAINGSYAVAGGGVTSLLQIGNGAGTNGTVTIGAAAGTVTFGGDGYANAVQVGVGTAGGTGTGTLTLNGGTVNLAGTTGTASASLNIGGQIATNAGTGTVTVNGGTLNVGQRILMGFNSAASNGTLTIAGGTVNVGTNGTLGYTGNDPGSVQFGTGTTTVNLNGGTLKLNGFKTTSATNTINFNGSTVTALGNQSFFIGNNGANDTAPSAIGTVTTKIQSGGAIFDTNTFNITVGSALVLDAGSTGGGLTKQGTGTLTLSGANTYTGSTSVTAGTLAIASTGSLGNTAIGVTGTSTFKVSTTAAGAVNLGTTGAGTAGAALNLGSGTTFSMVDGVIGTTNLQQQTSFATAGLTLNTATLNFELSGATADKLAVTGTASVTGTNTINLTPLAALTPGTYNLITAASGLNAGGTFQLSNGSTTGVVSTLSGANVVTLNNAAGIESVTVGASAAAMTWTGQTAGNGATDASWNTTGSTNFALGPPIRRIAMWAIPSSRRIPPKTNPCCDSWRVARCLRARS